MSLIKARRSVKEWWHSDVISDDKSRGWSVVREGAMGQGLLASLRSWDRKKKKQTLLRDNDCYYLYFICKIVKLHFKSLNFWQLGSTRKLTHKSINIYPYMDWSPSGFSAVDFSTQEYWSGYSSPRGLPNPAIKLGSPALPVDCLPSELPGKPYTPIYVGGIYATDIHCAPTTPQTGKKTYYHFKK